MKLGRIEVRDQVIRSLGIHLADPEASPGKVLQDLVSALPMRRALGQPQPSTSIYDPTSYIEMAPDM